VSWEGVDIIIILGLMGNNHDKYFGSDKRKIIILGLENAGKTSNQS
jgi:GTPase SAR1 family protein